MPNFSEGRDTQVIERLARALEGPGVRLLHLDPNKDANRTVFTLVGELDAVCESLYAGVAEAQRSIDMRHQAGEHIRVGAADVLPIVPLEDGVKSGQGVDWERAVSATHSLARRLANGLDVPVFLYEDSALREPFRSLPRCRRGGYEALESRFADPDDGPDFGPRHWDERCARTGATVIGLRGLLVAMNFTLDTESRELAQSIARAIRSSGPEGRPHRFERLRALGWVMEGYDNRAQVSVNILNPRITRAHEVLAKVRELAGSVPVLGAELIGLTPARVLVDAARDASGLMKLAWPAEQVLDGQAASRGDLLRLGGRALGLSHLRRAQGRGARPSQAQVLEVRLREAGLLPG